MDVKFTASENLSYTGMTSSMTQINAYVGETDQLRDVWSLLIEIWPPRRTIHDIRLKLCICNNDITPYTRPIGGYLRLFPEGRAI